VRCHFNASPIGSNSGGTKKPPKLLASLIAQLWRHLLFLYILKDVCKEQQNWISTFLIELFLIHSSATTGKITIPWYDAKGQHIFLPCHHFYSTLISSPFIRKYLKLVASWIALCSVVCEMPDLQSLSFIRSPFCFCHCQPDLERMPFLSNHPTVSDNWSVLFYVFGL
jgi:hypothetical protein